MANKSAGTLSVAVVAETEQLKPSLDKAGRMVSEFAGKYRTSAEATSRAADMMGRTASLSAEKAGRAFGVAAGGLAMLAGSAEGVAGTLTGTLARAFGAFAAGGPIALGVTVVADGIGWIGKRSSEAAAQAERLRQAHARQVEAERAASQERSRAHAKVMSDLQAEIDAIGRKNELEVDKRARGQSARLTAAQDADFAAGKDLKGPTAASLARRANAAEDADARARRFNEDFAAGRAQADARNDAANAAGWAQADRKVALRQQLEDAIALSKATEEQRKHWAEIQRIAELRRLGMKAEAEVAEKLLATTIAREEAEKGAAERKKVAAAQTRANDDAARRVRDLSAETDLERMQNRHADERNALAAQGVKLGETLKAQAYELALFKTEEANAAERARAAAEGQAAATAQAAQAARYYAEGQRQAADAAARASQMNTYGAGYGPLAQARDAKRRNANIARFKNHADNLAAEAPLGYGTVGAPQYDKDGNPIGVPDPFAFDLGSIFARQGKPKVKPSDYEFAAPGLFTPAYQFPAPGAPQMGGGGGDKSGGGGGVGLDKVTTDLGAAATDLRGSAEAADNAAKALGETADATTTAADSFGALADATGSLADGIGSAFAGLNEKADNALERVAALEAQLAAASFFGG